MKRYSSVLIIWSIYYFAYFGLQYQMTWMGKIIWLNFTLFGIIELVGIYMGTRLLKEFKIFIRPMRWLFFFSGFLCLIFQDQSTTAFLIAVLCCFISHQISDDALLPNTHDLHARNIPNPASVPSLHLVFLR